MCIMKSLHQNKEWLEEQYSKYGTSTIAKMVGRNDKTIQYWLKKFNIPMRTRSESMKITENRIHTVDVDYFKEIDTEEKAYFLGFLMADANLSIRTDNKHVETKSIDLTIHKSDVEILIKLKNAIKCSNEIKPKGNNMRLAIYNTHFADNLIHWGIAANKTGHEVFPNISEHLKHHFLRGYFDGDGCITWSKNGRLRGKVHFVSGYEMMKGIKDFIESKGVQYTDKSLHPKKGANAFELETATLPNIARIYDIIYKDATVFLTRKKKHFDAFMEQYINSPIAIKRYSPTLYRKV